MRAVCVLQHQFSALPCVAFQCLLTSICSGAQAVTVIQEIATISCMQGIKPQTNSAQGLSSHSLGPAKQHCMQGQAMLLRPVVFCMLTWQAPSTTPLKTPS